MNETIIVGPAYGRDYKYAKEARQAWDENRDFICYGRYKGMATNQADCFNMKCDVEIRYNNLEKVIYIPYFELKDVNGVVPEWDSEVFGDPDDEFGGATEEDIAYVISRMEEGK